MERSTQELFDELAEAPPAATPSESYGARERALALRRELRSRLDLPAVVQRVLVEEVSPPASAPVLAKHRHAVRISLAASLLEALPDEDVMAVLAAARWFELPAAAHALAQRSPALWPRLLAPGTVGHAVVRYLLARLERDPETRRTVLPTLEPLARAGFAPDLIYGVLVRDGSLRALAAVRDAAIDPALPGDTRAAAMLAHPDAKVLARTLVAARSHASSDALVIATLRLLNAGGLDEAFRAGDAERLFAGPAALGEAIVRWTEATPEDIDVGLVPMTWGVTGGRHLPFALEGSRDQHFVVAGKPVWAIRHYHLDDLEDPNLVCPVAPLGSIPPITRERLRCGTYLEGTLTLTFTRRAPGEHPFADAWHYEDERYDPEDRISRPTIEVAWWHGQRRFLEVALLPLGAASLDGAAPDVFAWPMPSSRPEQIYLYGLLLSGEPVEGVPTRVTVIAPVATARQRALLVAALDGGSTRG